MNITPVGSSEQGPQLYSWVSPREVVAVGKGAGTAPDVTPDIISCLGSSSHSRQERGCWSVRCLAGRIPCFPPTLSYSFLRQLVSANRNLLAADNELGWSFVMMTR